jgi:lysozyme family protein
MLLATQIVRRVMLASAFVNFGSRGAMTAFQAWLDFLGPEEGILSLDPTDPGNWTGGVCHVGQCLGSKFGISAAAHPTIDIAGLTLDRANSLRKIEYWDKVHGDYLPAPIAFMVADAAYMSGPDRAIRQMQQALGLEQDGDLGDKTTLKALATPAELFLPEFASIRLLFFTTLGLWPRDKGGWTRRLFRGEIAALALART